MVDTGQLRAIRTVAEEGSITAAAGKLGMSQPGLSRLVDRVEDEIGAALFIRGRKGAELTADGGIFIKFADSTLAAYDMLRASLSGRRRRSNSLQQVLRLVASTTPGEYLLPRIASEFTKQHPDISVETLITDSAGVANLLLTGEYEVGFAGQTSDFGALRYRKIASDEIVLAVPVSHRFASQDEVDVSQIANEKMLRREDGSGTYETVETVLSAHGQSLPSRPAELTLGSTQAVVSAVDAGIGIGFVTTRAIEQHAPSRVVAVRIAGAPIIRDLFIVYESGRQFSDSAYAFIKFVERQNTDHQAITG